MTPEEYNGLPPGEARERAQRLAPDAQLRLAVALSATKTAGAVGSTYTYWLRAWANPALPTALAVAGWEWGKDGLVNPRARIVLGCFGYEAIDRALQICFGGLGVNGKVKPHLTDEERTYICRLSGRPGWEAEAEAPKVKPAAPASLQMEMPL